MKMSQITVTRAISGGVPTVETVGRFRNAEGRLSYVGSVAGLRALCRQHRAGQLHALHTVNGVAVLEVSGE